MTKLLKLGILFLTSVVAKPVMLSIFNISYLSIISCLTSLLAYGIFLLASLIFLSRPDLSVLNWIFRTNQLVSMTLTLVTNLSYTVFVTTLLFTTLLRLLKSKETVFNLSIPNLLTPNVRFVKSVFLANSDVWTPINFFKVSFCGIIRQT